MSASSLVIVLLLLAAIAYQIGWYRSIRLAGGRERIRSLHSLPSHYGYLSALWCAVPALAMLCLWLAAEGAVVTALVVESLPPETQELPQSELELVLNDVRNLASGSALSPAADEAMESAAARYVELKKISAAIMTVVFLSLAIAGMAIGRRVVAPHVRARNLVEGAMRYVLLGCSLVAIFTTVGILLSVLFESIRFFQAVPLGEFLFGLNWSPQTAIRADQVGSSGAFGAVPLFTGTLLIAGIALLVAVPVGLMSAVYLAEYAAPGVRAVAKPLLEILAGIPTVVYGFFAALTLAPLVRELGTSIGLNVASESALAAGFVMGIMIIPFVSSLSDDVITAVPSTMRDGSYGLGATRSETIRRVVLPAALPGIVGSILLAASRAIGETMIVVMAAGLAANLTANPLQAVTTVTVQIVTLLVGDQEFDSAKTLAAFALGLMLFVVTLVLNVIALQVVRRYREQYE